MRLWNAKPEIFVNHTICLTRLVWCCLNFPDEAIVTIINIEISVILFIYSYLTSRHCHILSELKAIRYINRYFLSAKLWWRYQPNEMSRECKKELPYYISVIYNGTCGHVTINQTSWSDCKDYHQKISVILFYLQLSYSSTLQHFVRNNSIPVNKRILINC